MKNLAMALAILCGMILLPTMSRADELGAEFLSPPDAARPWVYWFFMDGNLSREGMTADLEAMQAAGIGGVIIMEVNVGIPRGAVDFMSEAWCALFNHAVEEAERLGLEITLNAGPGWTGSGGPWVKAEQSMQHLVASAVEVEGPSVFDAVLARPEPRKPYFGEQHLTPENARAREEFYADEVVLAVPKTSGPLLDKVDEKALYLREPYTSKPGVPPYLPAPAKHPQLPDQAIIPVASVIDLTDHLQADGRLTWNAPKGAWTILRFGRRTTGANTRPAPQPGLGLESDKFDPVALEAHFEAFIVPLLDAIGPRPLDRRTGWTMLHIDSWEMGSQNWTKGFRTIFRQRRGYDPIPYLPVMTGRLVQSLEISERFLWDLRLTAQELVIERHAGHLKKLGRQHGFGLSIEPYDMNPTSDMVLGGVADVPMCEFWSHGFGFDSDFTCFEAASVAHTLGRPIVAAEAFTAGSGEAWQLYPGAMKNQGDWAFGAGINRIVFHRFAHQPWLDRKPGMTMGPYGVHWDRTQTWWPMVTDYHRYLARCQLLLRPGVTVADLCYLIPEGAPHVFRPPSSAFEGALRDRRGYNFDGCAPDTLIEGARVQQGRITLPSGASYQLLVLPAFDTMRPALLRKIKALAEAGATIVGSPPHKSPSLSNYPRCDEEVEALSRELWGGFTPPSEGVARRVGQGRLYWGGDLHAPLAAQTSHAPLDKARWIWGAEDASAMQADPGSRYFRRSFHLDPKRTLASATIAVTADNGFQLFLNNNLILKGENFNQIYEKEVRFFLQPGDNLLALRVVNGGDSPNPAGLILTLHGEYKDGDPFSISSDASWRASKKPTKGWRSAMEALPGWTPAQDLGAARMAPWNLDPTQGSYPELYPNYEATAAILTALDLPPDFESDAPVRYTHRKTQEADFYFVANRTAQKIDASCSFRISGRQPELWDPLTGLLHDLPDFQSQPKTTLVPLHFDAYQSFFLVFRKELARTNAQPETKENFPTLRRLTTLDGPWQVHFDTASGGPGAVIFDSLIDWSQHTDPGIRHYSGIATYRKSFTWTAADTKKTGPLWLDIGPVPGMARIRLNGHALGGLWTAPWRLDVGNAIKNGENLLEIDIANLWPNRLIGDSALEAEDQISWTTWNPYKPNAPLLESGLRGPVRILEAN